MSHSPDHSAATLYCTEDAGDVVSPDADTWISHPLSSSISSVQSPPSDESTINRLFDSEPHHMPHPDYLRRSIDLTARQDSINWILKVHAHYQFRPVTAFLSVNYLDRFISTHSLPASGGWPFQLVSVACLSLAAKMEESYVPLLIDLQVFEPRFVFEPKTVQRMELWVMSNLNWRLRSVTPFDYLDFFISKLNPSSGSKPEFLSISSELIVNTTRVLDFLGFPPSVIAASAVFSAAGKTVNLPAGPDRLPDSFHERLNQEMVRSCHQLMEEYLIDTCHSSEVKVFGAEPTEPPSPVGVLDTAACGSCGTRSENPVSGSGSEPSEAEPPNKRLRSSASDVQ